MFLDKVIRIFLLNQRFQLVELQGLLSATVQLLNHTPHHLNFLLFSLQLLFLRLFLLTHSLVQHMLILLRHTLLKRLQCRRRLTRFNNKILLKYLQIIAQLFILNL